ncbi:hypothetical protein P5673_014388 [Acropora cervicornis]|uniref:Uncharacterized protein n=1 Tax=Acropora cervicornis TaxID=6130 RepID=A0AAD9V6B4_ACRCE|nr:hypothetical protein P5673_014388 [Acropora cervicornis]
MGPIPSDPPGISFTGPVGISCMDPRPPAPPATSSIWLIPPCCPDISFIGPIPIPSPIISFIGPILPVLLFWFSYQTVHHNRHPFHSRGRRALAPQGQPFLDQGKNMDPIHHCPLYQGHRQSPPHYRSSAAFGKAWHKAFLPYAHILTVQCLYQLQAHQP